MHLNIHVLLLHRHPRGGRLDPNPGIRACPWLSRTQSHWWRRCGGMLRIHVALQGFHPGYHLAVSPLLCLLQPFVKEVKEEVPPLQMKPCIEFVVGNNSCSLLGKHQEKNSLAPASLLVCNLANQTEVVYYIILVVATTRIPEVCLQLGLVFTYNCACFCWEEIIIV